MNNIKINIFIIFSLILLLTSCQGAKEGLIGGKRDNTDEFLVKKKNPLVLPPEFSKLPKPMNSKSEVKRDNRNEDTNLKKLIGAESGKATSNKNSKGDNSLENSILKTLNED